MSLFFRAAACASVLATTIVTMATGTQLMAAMLTPDTVASATATLPPATATPNAPDVVFVSSPVVQSLPDPVQDDEPAASVAEAVADYRAGDEDLTDEERCLAVAIFYESKGESLSGQMAVAHVILNRVESPRFPSTICGVVTQRSQFSFVRGGRLPGARPGASWNTARAVARAALADAWDSPVGEAMFFHTTRVSPRWNRTKVASIGNHVFYR